MIRSLLGAVALVGLSFAPAVAQGGSSPVPAAQPVADAVPASGKVVCHHDGEIIQAQTGPVICHQKHTSGVTNMSREWLREQQLRSSTMNH
ncbi:MAG TPA: hypothetical protein VHU87_14330 [Rhizomicrobium sp.]|nr:hypothetical protein [Rhizomicrobium sp.]